jgi:elongation factor P
MISSNDFRNGVTIVIEGQLWTVIEFLHVKPGKGSAFVRTRLKNVKSGATVERTFRAGEKLERATVDNREMQMLYNDDDGFHFMDNETFENITLQRDLIGGPADFLKDGMRVDVQMHDGVPIGVSKRPIPASKATPRPAPRSRPSSRPARPCRFRCSSIPAT